MRRPIALLATVALALQTGCAGMPPQPSPITVEDKTALGRIGLAAGNTPPEVSIEVLTRSKSEGGFEGFFAGARLGLGSCLDIPYSAAADRYGLAALVYAPVCLAFMAVGAGRGAVAAAPQSAGTEETKAAELKLVANLGRETHTGIQQALRRYAQEHHLDAAFAATPHGAPADSARFNRDIDTLLKVSISKLSAQSTETLDIAFRLLLTAQVRLVRMRDKALLDSFTYHYIGTYRKAEEWQTDNGATLRDELALAYREIVEQALDELVLIFVPQGSQSLSASAFDKTPQAGETASAASSARERVPAYMLNPLAPKIVTEFAVFGKNKFYAGLGLTKVPSRTPLLAWEPLPAAFSQPDYADRIRDITYDIRIYDAVKPALALEAGREIYRRDQLTDTKHRVEKVLDACAIYFWTLRARFKLNGQPRVTEWTGAFHTSFGKAAPWWWRRSAAPPLAALWPNNRYWLPFQTPAVQAQDCD